MAKENQPEVVMMLAINATPSRKRFPPSFFQNFSSSDLSSERLKIPVGFIKHMEGKTSGLISIMGPSGDFWQVDLFQENGNVFLDNGWPTFIRDHFLECGDLLIFRYDGEFCFSVQVFDQSSCEKEVAFHSKCSQDPRMFCARVQQKRQREEEAASLDKSKKVRGSSCELHSERIDKNWEAQMDTSDTGRHQQDEVVTTEKSFCHETK